MALMIGSLVLVYRFLCLEDKVNELCRWLAFGICPHIGDTKHRLARSLSYVPRLICLVRYLLYPPAASFAAFSFQHLQIHSFFSNKKFHGLSRAEMSAWLKQSMESSRTARIGSAPRSRSESAIVSAVLVLPSFSATMQY